MSCTDFRIKCVVISLQRSFPQWKKATPTQIPCTLPPFSKSSYFSRFKESTHLRKHLYTHTGERPHYCALCSKGFCKSKYFLKQTKHLKINVKIAGYQLLMTSISGFQTSSDLKRHKKTRVHQVANHIYFVCALPL